MSKQDSEPSRNGTASQEVKSDVAMKASQSEDADNSQQYDTTADKWAMEYI